MIIPFGFLKQPVSGVAPIYDNVSPMFTLRTPDMTTLWTNAILKLRRDSDNATAFIFGGATKDSTITTSTFIDSSSNTVPSATTLGTWVGANSAFVVEWIGMTDNNTINISYTASEGSTSLQATFITTGTIDTKNGKPDIAFSTSDRLKSFDISNMDTGNTFTLFAVAYRDTANTIGTIITTRDVTSATNSRFILQLDRRSQANIAVLANTVPTNFITNMSSQVNSSNQRLLTEIVTSSNHIGRYNAAEQEDVAWTGSYDNVGGKIAEDRTASAPLVGGIQEIIIFPSDKTSDLSTVEGDMDSYYSIP